jgi:hypothetical protein
MSPVGETHACQELLGAIAARLPAQLQRDLDVLLGGQRRDEVERLEHETDLRAPEPGPRVLPQGGQVGAIEPDPPSLRPVESREQAQQCVFPLPDGRSRRQIPRR